MTEEAKNNLLNYMLGKMPNESGSDEILPPTISEIANSIDSFARQHYSELSTNWTPQQLFTRGDYIILWCSDYDTEDVNSPTYNQWKKSFVIVLDKNYNPLEYIDTFNSGTALNPLSYIDANDSGDGNIYGIDLVFDNDLTTVSRYRVIILNDFTLNNFEIRLLNSYNIPDYEENLVVPLQMKKSLTEAKYLILYSTANSGGGGLEFVNNVGSENEWNFYHYTGSKNIRWNGYEEGFPVWGDDGLEFKIFADYTVSEYNGNSIAIAVLTSQVDDDGNTSCVDDIDTNLPSECKNVGQIAGTTSNANSAFVTTYTTNSSLSDTKYVIEYQISDLSYKIWYSKDDYIYESIENGFIFSSDTIEPFVINNQFYFFRHYQYYKSTFDESYNVTYEFYDNNLYLNQIHNNKLTEFFIKDFEQQENVNYSLFTSNIFNLYEFGLIYSTMVLKLSQVYNPTNYNGEPFLDINSLNSNSAILYSNEIPVFARNLYNRTQNSATTTSTVEIPNNYLNDKVVEAKNLISENNNIIVSDTTEFTKNVYEAVYLNFINTISVVNQNDTQSVSNDEVAIKLTTSINNPVDYDDLKLTKFRINYQDGTNYVSKLQATLQEDESYQLLMTFYLSKLADTLDLISEDEQTVYLTYSLANTETNKYYSFKQRVRIGGN